MGILELVGAVVSHLPVVDLVTHGMAALPAGPEASVGDLAAFGYDIGQLIACLNLLALGLTRFGNWIQQFSAATPWSWDDSWGRKIGAWALRGGALLARAVGLAGRFMATFNPGASAAAQAARLAARK